MNVLLAEQRTGGDHHWPRGPSGASNLVHPTLDAGERLEAAIANGIPNDQEARRFVIDGHAIRNRAQEMSLVDTIVGDWVTAARHEAAADVL